jgi:shikimate dehydrogenase
MERITGSTRLCVLFGDPVHKSLSPLLHNTGYRTLGIDHEFVYCACKVAAHDIGDACRSIRALGIRGVSLTMPHKESIIPFLDRLDDAAKEIGAVNTVVNEEGVLTGYNTDFIGAITPLRARTALHGRRVAVLGTGGAARAVAYGVAREGASLHVFGRRIEGASEIAAPLGGAAHLLSDHSALSAMEIFVNATPLGMFPHVDATPLPLEVISPGAVVLDTVYHPLQTKLVQDTKARGGIPICGTEMLLHQAAAQFSLFTGREAPVEQMEARLSEYLKGSR